MNNFAVVHQSDVSKAAYEISSRRVSQPPTSRRNDLSPQRSLPLAQPSFNRGALLTLIIIGLGSRQDHGFERVADVRPRPSYRRICPVSGHRIYERPNTRSKSLLPLRARYLYARPWQFSTPCYYPLRGFRHDCSKRN